ncbi:MAG: hypothetical protein ACQSGP_22780, partial [Frankia sp.]
MRTDEHVVSLVERFPAAYVRRAASRGRRLDGTMLGELTGDRDGRSAPGRYAGSVTSAQAALAGVPPQSNAASATGCHWRQVSSR